MRLSRNLIEANRKAGFLTTTESARLVNRTANTIRQWCDAGKVAHKRDGEAYFVNKASLLERAGIL